MITKIKTLTQGIWQWFHMQTRQSGSLLTKAGQLLSYPPNFPVAAPAPALPPSQVGLLLLPSIARTQQKSVQDFCLFFFFFLVYILGILVS